MKVNLRMNLSDFIDTDIETIVMDKLETIHKDSIKYYLTLWYPDGKMKPSRLKKFIVDYEKKLHLKTNIKVGSELKPNEFIWFDLTNEAGIANSQVRFEYVYTNKESMLAGLDEFHKCAKFCTSEKPRKQKRNDYESSDSRQ